MLTSYVAGNLLGRALLSYLIVWLVCLALARFDWRAAFVRSRRWYSMVAVVIVFLAGLAGTFGKAAVAT